MKPPSATIFRCKQFGRAGICSGGGRRTEWVSVLEMVSQRLLDGVGVMETEEVRVADGLMRLRVSVISLEEVHEELALVAVGVAREPVALGLATLALSVVVRLQE